eukprot:GAHX01001333.1.p1 GENE.GAHX01001333.1~~GAHX01001333.1.p1  ORF type:complete len:605 (-),score=83.81 GAHX01001333.1:117-1931(-)
MVENTIKSDTKTCIRSYIRFVFISVPPISKKTNHDMMGKKFIKFDSITDLGEIPAFGEYSFHDYERIANAPDQGVYVNELRMLVEETKVNPLSIFNFISTDEKALLPQHRQLIESLWLKFFSESDYIKIEDNSENGGNSTCKHIAEDNILIQKLYGFLLLLFKQPKLSYMNNKETLLMALKQIVIKRIGNTHSFYKIHPGYFQGFLQNEYKIGKLSIYRSEQLSSGVNKLDFWRNYHHFVSNYGPDRFPVEVTKNDIDVIYGECNEKLKGYYISTLYNLFHLGYIFFDLPRLQTNEEHNQATNSPTTPPTNSSTTPPTNQEQQETTGILTDQARTCPDTNYITDPSLYLAKNANGAERRIVYHLEWTNLLKRIRIDEGYTKYLSKYSAGIGLSDEQKQSLMILFERSTWKYLMKAINPNVISHHYKKYKTDYTVVKECEFRDCFIDILKQKLEDKARSICPRLTQRQLDYIIDCAPEYYHLKVNPENDYNLAHKKAKLDLCVILKIGPDANHKFKGIFEFKTKSGLGVATTMDALTSDEKQYQYLDIGRDVSTLYFAISLNCYGRKDSREHVKELKGTIASTLPRDRVNESSDAREIVFTATRA